MSLICPTLSSLSNGHIIRTNGNFSGSIASYSCNSGYKLNGTNDRRCVNGQWTGEEVACNGEGMKLLISSIRILIFMHTAVVCNQLHHPTNGSVVFSETTFMSSATYSCSEGYKLNGSAVRMCNATGHWIPDEPACDRRFF